MFSFNLDAKLLPCYSKQDGLMKEYMQGNKEGAWVEAVDSTVLLNIRAEFCRVCVAVWAAPQ